MLVAIGLLVFMASAGLVVAAGVDGQHGGNSLTCYEEAEYLCGALCLPWGLHSTFEFANRHAAGMGAAYQRSSVRGKRRAIWPSGRQNATSVDCVCWAEGAKVSGVDRAALSSVH